MKTNVALFKAEATEVMEGAETARNPITDELLEGTRVTMHDL